jgi:hypothetical protein
MAAGKKLSTPAIHWIITLEQADAHTLAPWRLIGGVEVGVYQGQLWLRGPQLSGELANALRSLPAVHRYKLSPPNLLLDSFSSLPVATVPAIEWVSLQKWITPQIEQPVSAANPPDKLALRLVESFVEKPSGLLLTNLGHWRNYVETAPEFRLHGLKFAADSSGAVIILGQPLPAVSASHFTLHGRIACPAGFEWSPKVSPAVLERLFRVKEQEMVLLLRDGTHMRLSLEQFVPASRAAVRLTAQGVGA